MIAVPSNCTLKYLLFTSNYCGDAQDEKTVHFFSYFTLQIIDEKNTKFSRTKIYMMGSVHFLELSLLAYNYFFIENINIRAEFERFLTY